MNKIFFFLLVFVVQIVQIKAQWYDQKSLNATILIEKEVNSQIVPLGAGILMLNYKDRSTAVVITCAHLLNRSSIIITLNADSSFIKYCQDYGKKKIVGEKLIWELVENKVRAAVFMEKKQYEICS